MAREVLFSGQVEEDSTAYFYSIVAESGKQWWPYYIGMTYRQSAAIRNQQLDHQRRYQELCKAHSGKTFRISLGTPTFHRGAESLEAISAMEGLLIYSNWHEDMVNQKKVQTFSSVQHLYVCNTGWTEHLEPELAFGVFYRSRAHQDRDKAIGPSDNTVFYPRSKAT